MGQTIIPDKHCVDMAEETLNAHAVFKQHLRNLYNSALPNHLVKFSLLDVLRDMAQDSGKSSLLDYCTALAQTHYGAKSDYAYSFGVDQNLVEKAMEDDAGSYTENMDIMLTKCATLVDCLHKLAEASPDITTHVAERFYAMYSELQNRLRHVSSCTAAAVTDKQQPRPR